MSRKVDPAQIQIAIARYRAGATLKQAAKGICAVNTLRAHMMARGEPIRPQRRGGAKRGPRDPERTLAIYRRHRAGESARQIGTTVGLTAATVLQHVWTAERMLLDRQAADLPRRARIEPSTPTTEDSRHVA